LALFVPFSLAGPSDKLKEPVVDSRNASSAGVEALGTRTAIRFRIGLVDNEVGTGGV
jgi:hypothetical protein